MVPDPEWTGEWTAQAAGETAGEVAPRDNPAYLRALMAAVDRVNGGLSATEKVRRIIVADEPFSIDNEQLTPSMKLKRSVVLAESEREVEALYA